MAKKIEIIEKALVVTDTVTSEILLDVPKGQYYYNFKKLYEESFILLYNIDFKDDTVESLQQIHISEAVDSTLTPFTESTFSTFCRTNLN